MVPIIAARCAAFIFDRMRRTMRFRLLLALAVVIGTFACSKSEKPKKSDDTAADEDQPKSGKKSSSKRDDEDEPELQPKAKQAAEAQPTADAKDDLNLVEVALVNTTDDRPIPVSRAQTHWLDEDIIVRLPAGTKVTRQECHDGSKIASAHIWRCRITFKQDGKDADGWVHGSSVGKPN